MQKSTLDKIKSIVGGDNFLDSIEDKLVYSYDGTPLISHKPEAIILPSSVDEISQVFKLANEEEFSIVPRGSGTGLSGGSVPTENSIVMLLNKWDNIEEIDAENLTAWVQPGVVTSKLHNAVEAKGLFYPPDPGSQNICTIGGNVAENAGGLRGLKYGVTKNYVMGIEMVLPNGDVIVNGGKNVKDVAGYNIRDLIVGSEGTLGVFTKILVKLIPKPQTSKTLLAYFDKITDAAETVSEIIANHIIPCTVEFLDNTTINCVEDYTKIGLPRNAGAILLLEVDGHQSVVEEEAIKVEAICKKNNAQQVKVAANESEALKLKEARRTAFSALARVKPTTILEDATVPRSNLAILVEKIDSIAKKHNLQMGNFGHAGDGNLHPTCLTDERDTEEIKRVEKAFHEIYEETIKLGGTVTGEHGVGLAKKDFLAQMIDVPAMDMMKKIKLAIDPNNVLNPGKIFSHSPKCEGKME
jgi:glycolate dehydrogenase FAD-linked subunit